jgi:hypothetical protein
MNRIAVRSRPRDEGPVLGGHGEPGRTVLTLPAPKMPTVVTKPPMRSPIESERNLGHVQLQRLSVIAHGGVQTSIWPISRSAVAVRSDDGRPRLRGTR